MEEVTFWVFEHILGALFGPCQALRMLYLQWPCFIILRILFFERREKAYNSPNISDAKPEKNRQKCPNLKIVPGHTCMYNTHTMLQKQSSECTRVSIFKREKIRRLEYALFLLVLWRLGVKTGGHRDPRVPRDLGRNCIKFLLNNNDDH